MSLTVSEFRAMVSGRVLVCDGAMGTMLHAAGNALDQSLPALSCSDPDLVRAVHARYVDAGVDIVQSNTFGANRLRLHEFGLADRLGEINRDAVRIAREAAGARPGVLVAGSVSPAVSVQQRRRVSASARTDAVTEQLGLLDGAGVDLIVLETFGHLDELLEAARIAVEETDLPVIAQATFGPDGRTLSGHPARDVAHALGEIEVAAIGTNCTLGPRHMLDVVRELCEHTDLPVTGQPNAGLPRRTGPARFEYDIDAEYLVRYVGQLVEVGARVVGGCCGTTPTQLAGVVELVRERQARRRTTVTGTVPAAPAPAPAVRDPGHSDLLAVELTPDDRGGTEQAVDAARRLHEHGVNLISVGAGGGVRARLSPVDLALHLHQRLGVDTVATVSTWDRTIMALQADLLGAHALGMHRIVCETGNPPLVGDYPHVDGIWDVDSIGLIELLTGLNDGTDFYGLPLPTRTTFEIGARINPGGRDLAAAAARARDKIAAGAQFLITRPVYAVEDLERLLEQIGEPLPPVLVSIRPLSGFAEAEYLTHEVPDVHVPPRVLDLLDRAGSGGQRVGLELATELAQQVRPLAGGLVVVPNGDPVDTVLAVAGER
ncbi:MULTISPECIES: bifunctional homocysteine S-methyltransferase/methylenetetrahydrofolate reductase [Pseudonocardia]|uniref:Bifunctional homocysteine S-methyltransferase/5,10-methylenetetrahydrofolate reductase n=2 Tax=Pseudonocardia TaxID=1847 RepID=A0A1Y2MKI3_PSEAH|nr:MULTISPECIES: bifunctional homocysteine S-methyltransferase/methylenetetrahydrofolate reductase [Pseudonocardia]OSY35764.1 Bifunctional homocysteine S-methyltransferase/5,10-methylenetetrahydrofolate reductase [Pseudonocardia autotrophica]TDN74544.1 homocysteine S-methyltransferase [Pseudonocardia autotrophica]BBG05312.1 bifunctional homocysteine S-methyltransferase/methylenetetrahydrofolate reductase [Pseudonocardia autotrophica]GEC27436.1 bifunctional homocysteine S-methyltransferase/methy